MDVVLQAGVNAITSGSLYALGAVGLTLVFGILGLVNFAHGDMLTLGAFAALVANTQLGMSVWFAVFIAAGVVAAFGLASEYVIWRPLRRTGAGTLQFLLMAIGLALVLRYSIQFAFGGGFRTYDGVDQIDTYTLGSIRIGTAQAHATILAIIALVATGLLLARTRIGTQMRALSDNFELAESSGVDTSRVVAITWLVGGALAGIAGVMAGLLIRVEPQLGWNLLLTLFACVIVGGIGNPYGALLGAYVIAFAQEFTVALAPRIDLIDGVIDGRYRIAVGFAIMIIVLLFRPRGILGRPEAVN